MFNEYINENSSKMFAWVIGGLIVLVGVFGATPWYVKAIILTAVFATIVDEIQAKRGRDET